MRRVKPTSMKLSKKMSASPFLRDCRYHSWWIQPEGDPLRRQTSALAIRASAQEHSNIRRTNVGLGLQRAVGIWSMTSMTGRRLRPEPRLIFYPLSNLVSYHFSPRNSQLRHSIPTPYRLLQCSFPMLKSTHDVQIPVIQLVTMSGTQKP